MQVAWEKGVEKRSFSRKYKTVKAEKQEDWIGGWKPYRFREGSHEASSPGVQLQK